MKVSDLKLEAVLTTDPGESIADAAERMRFYEIGSLAVVENGRLVGIVTERDVLGATADRAEAAGVSVRSYMTTGPTTVTPETDLADAAALMLNLGVRHLPVVDGAALLGMVSIRDVLLAQVEPGRDVARSG